MQLPFRLETMEPTDVSKTAKVVALINSHHFTVYWRVIQFVVLYYNIMAIAFRLPAVASSSSTYKVADSGWLILDYGSDLLQWIDLALCLWCFHIPETTEKSDHRLKAHSDAHRLIRKPSRIFTEYTKSSTFPFDIMALIPLEIFVLMTSTRYWGLFRINKMLRLIKVVAFWDNARDALYLLCHITLQRATERLIAFLMIYVICVHWMASLWLLIGDYLRIQHQSGWMLRDNGLMTTDDPNDLNHIPFLSKYCRALYFAASTSMTTGFVHSIYPIPSFLCSLHFVCNLYHHNSFHNNLSASDTVISSLYLRERQCS